MKLIWLRKNWFIIVLGFAILYFGGVSLIDIIEDWKISDLNRQINLKSKRIALVEQQNWEKEQEIMKLNEANIKLEQKQKESDRKLSLIARERDSLKAKIEKLSPNEVVVRTQQILQTTEIWLEERGILFSLVASKKNLNVLEDFSLVKKERDEWQGKHLIATQEIANRDIIIVAQNVIISNKDIVIGDMDKTIVDWAKKAGLFERKAKRNRGRGFVYGIAAGVIASMIIWGGK